MGLGYTITGVAQWTGRIELLSDPADVAIVLSLLPRQPYWGAAEAGAKQMKAAAFAASCFEVGKAVDHESIEFDCGTPVRISDTTCDLRPPVALYRRFATPSWPRDDVPERGLHRPNSVDLPVVIQQHDEIARWTRR
ncbi:hypothetical protein [Mycobacterium sp. URHB0021]